MLQAYNPYKTCTGVDHTACVSETEACIESITGLIYHNIQDMSSEVLQYVVAHRRREKRSVMRIMYVFHAYYSVCDFDKAYYTRIPCVLAVHDFDNTYCRRINGVLAELFEFPLIIISPK